LSRRRRYLTAASAIDQLHSVVPDVVIHAAADTKSTTIIVPAANCSTARTASGDSIRRQPSDCSSDRPPLVRHCRINISHHQQPVSLSTTAPLHEGTKSCLAASGASSSSLPQLSLATNNAGGSCAVGGSSHALLRDNGSNNLSLGALHVVQPEGISNLMRSRGACRPCHDLSTVVAAASTDRPRFVVGTSGCGLQNVLVTNSGAPLAAAVATIAPASPSPCSDHDRATLLQNEVVAAMTSMSSSVSSTRDQTGWTTAVSHDHVPSACSVDDSSSSLSDTSRKSISPRGSGCSMTVTHQALTSAGTSTSVVLGGSKVKDVAGPSSSAVRGRLAVVSGTKAWWSKSDETPTTTSIAIHGCSTENWNEAFGGGMTSPSSSTDLSDIAGGSSLVIGGRRLSTQDDNATYGRPTHDGSVRCRHLPLVLPQWVTGKCRR
jgi:hypothetical protein